MQSFPFGYRALVIGASGAIGGALVERLRADAGCGEVRGLHRRSDPPVDFDAEHSVSAAAACMRAHGPFHLIVVASGVLHGEGLAPEKKLSSLNYAQMTRAFRTNALGPALAIAHFSPLLDHQRAVLVVLSARVGSIGDNRIGGWYSYRASKSALNMLMRTAAIELRRSQPNAVLASLHPGTVASALSRPYRGESIGRSPQAAAADLLRVIDSLGPADSGRFLAYDGSEIPW